MCCSFKPAVFTGTTVYAGLGRHPDRGTVHVMLYENTAQNLDPGPNAMLLHLPANEIGEANALDLSQCTKVLTTMREAIWPVRRTRGGFRGADSFTNSKSVQIFKSGSYTVVSATDASLIPGALKRVPKDVRPKVNRKLFNWYGKNIKNHVFLLCCFDAKQAKKTEPFGVWYESNNPTMLMAPGLDAHDGNPPQIGANVDVDHHVIFGTHDFGTPALTAVHYSEDLDTKTEQLLPTHVCGLRELGQRPNGDWILPVGEMLLGNATAIQRKVLTN